VDSIDSGARAVPGIFITLEGPDGAGKSSQHTLLAERIRTLGLEREVVATREPGSTELGERVREILMAEGGSHDPVVDALLFNAARRRLVTSVIAPALERGAIVVCDRYADSTLAYQGYGGGVPLETLRAIGWTATAGVTPTRTVLFDIATEVGLARRMGGPTAQLTKFETSADFDREFHERVRAGYLDMAAADPDRWRVIDAAGSSEDVASAIWEAVRDLLEV
jgi:dTMP kinase